MANEKPPVAAAPDAPAPVLEGAQVVAPVVPAPAPAADPEPAADPAPPTVERKFAKQVEAVQAAAAIKKVRVRITKMGSDKISTGKHVDTLGDELFAFGETPLFDEPVARELEARGFVEIQ